MTGTTFITDGDSKFSALKFDRLCPFVLVVKAG